MTAEIINLWLNRHIRNQPDARVISQPIKACFTKYTPQKPMPDHEVIDRDCPCSGCIEFFKSMPRATYQIMRDLELLRMTGAQDEPKRQQLIAELRANSDPFNW